MPIELTHLGEAIVQMLIMEDPAYFVSEWKNGLETLNGPEVFREAELEMFSGVNGVCDHEVYREVQLAPFADKIFDGASRVDLIVPMTADEALPIEVKLGETRLSKSRLEDEWLLPCRATHHNTRWSGNMMAILDRRFNEQFPPNEPLMTRTPRVFRLVPHWCIVVRAKTKRAWERAWNANEPPPFKKKVSLVSFDALAANYGQEKFDKKVSALLSSRSYYERWAISP